MYYVTLIVLIVVDYPGTVVFLHRHVRKVFLATLRRQTVRATSRSHPHHSSQAH